MRRYIYPLIAAVVFVSIVIYGMYVNPRREGFVSADDLIRSLQAATGQLDATKSYEQWVGYTYAHIPDSGPVLNDVKARVFQPECQFRRDWSTTLPAGMVRPIGADKPELANAAYKSWLDNLAKGSNDVILQLDDFKKRFLEPSCEFQVVSNPTKFNANYKPVFPGM